MASTEDRNERRVKRLGELPQAIEPPEGLWLRIAEELNAPEAHAPRGRPARPSFWTSSRPSPRYAAAAAVVLALITGALAGHWLVPAAQRTAQAPHSAPVSAPAQVSQASAVPVSFMRDPRYQQQRAQLLADLSKRMAALPPPTRQKVLASLASIQQSMRELQAALGRDPSNALLQELLVDTCQDEMRVLVSVNEAGQDATQL